MSVESCHFDFTVTLSSTYNAASFMSNESCTWSLTY